MKERETQRESEGIKDKANWFREGGFTATLTIPTTTNDTLVIAVRKALTVASGPRHTKTKILENQVSQSWQASPRVTPSQGQPVTDHVAHSNG